MHTRRWIIMTAAALVGVSVPAGAVAYAKTAKTSSPAWTPPLLLHGGGWGVVVFDLGEISWLDARRIDLSTWFRFRRAVENTPTILVLLGEESCAKSCASLVLRCQRGANHWSRAAASVEAGISTFEGFEVEGEVTRSRVLSQPADLARWQTHTP